PASMDPQIAAVYPAQFLQLLDERSALRPSFRIALRPAHQYADPAHLLGLLRARRERPRRRAADERNERAPFHSITSSARTSSIVGIFPSGRETVWLGMLSMGISILQQTPSDANVRSTEPPNSYGMSSRMMPTPYLQSGEAATVGPPISRHTIDSFAASLCGPRS